MKKNFIIAGLLIAGLYNAQQDGSVGINTKSPSGATLQVKIAESANPTDGQGVAVPNVTKTTLNAMEKGKIAISALVYVTDASATDVATTGKVKEVGYHYFDGTEWVKLGGGASSSSSANLYTENGTLSSARTVTQNNQNLTFITGGTPGKQKSEHDYVSSKFVVDGAFNTTGAVYGNIRVVSDLINFKIQPDDYAVVVNVAGPQNIPLPDPANFEGRILLFRNGSASTGTSGTYTFTGFQPKNNTTLLASRSALIMSDGKNWYFLAGV